MPYLDHIMASSLSEAESNSNSVSGGKEGSIGGSSDFKNNIKKSTRTIPSSKCSKHSSTVSCEASTASETNKNINFKYKVDLDVNKLSFMRNLLKIEVSLLCFIPKNIEFFIYFQIYIFIDWKSF